MATSGKAKRVTSVSPKQSARDRRAAEQKRRERQQTILLAVVAVVVVIGVVAAIAVGLINQSNATVAATDAYIPPAALTNYTDIEAQKLIGTTPDGYPFMGKADAPVLLEEFGSLSCIVCQEYHNTMTVNLLDEVLAGRVKYVFIPVVTTGEFDPTQITKAALAANLQGKFWDFQDIAFDWQTRYPGGQANAQPMLDAAAKALALDLTKFHNDMNDSAAKTIIDKGETAFETRAQPKGQPGTPTVFLDGIQISPPVNGQTSMDLNQLRGVIETRAAAAKK
jgi:protein-disulfide isomerase